jgi:dimethylaniline monooxygenase (N-oxide forming)
MAAAQEKRLAIIGAGSSGLTACKHALAKGFRPVVFEAADAVGGVWARTLACTRLQSPAEAYRFSDFPWPPEVRPEEFPRSDQVAAYMAAYARQFGVVDCVRFGSKVLGAEYVGASEAEVAAWEQWSGNGEAFGDGTGVWHLTVQHGETEETQVRLDTV